ncbi:MAG: hypothetical protein CW341_10575 [Bacteroidetes bacterium]|nr:hypothetical protein [Bacteroidota bacterium]
MIYILALVTTFRKLEKDSKPNKKRKLLLLTMYVLIALFCIIGVFAYFVKNIYILETNNGIFMYLFFGGSLLFSFLIYLMY